MTGRQRPSGPVPRAGERHLRGLAILGLLLGGAPLAGGRDHAAAGEDGGTRSVFAVGAGSRAMALGGAFTAVSDDASGILWNPGGLGFIGRGELQVGHADLQPDGVREIQASVALPSWRWGVAGVSFRSFTAGGIEGRDERNAVTDPDLEDQESEIMFGYGRQIGPAVGVGGGVKLRRQSLAGYSAGGAGLDLGVLIRPGPLFHSDAEWVERLRVGLAVRNAARPSIRLDREDVSDPTALRAGVAHDVPLGAGRGIMGTFDFEHSPGTSPGLHAGAELRLHPQLVLRGGLDAGDLTAGAGLAWKDLLFDYTFTDGEPGGQHRAGLSVRFGRSVEERRLDALAAQESALQARLAEEFGARQTARIDSLLEAAEAARREGDIESALSLAGVVSTLDPSDGRARVIEAGCWRSRAGDLETKDDLSGAALAWSRVLSLAPGDSQAVRSLNGVREEADRRAARSQELKRLFGEALDAFTRGDLAAARAGFTAVLAADPADAESVRMLERTREALSRRLDAFLADVDRLCRAGQPEAAGASLVGALALDPQAPGLDRARALIDRTRAARAAAPSPGPPAARPPAGAEAPARADLSPERRREIEDLYRRGIGAMKAGRSAEAVRLLEIVFEADPDHAQAREHLAREYLNRGMEAFAAGRLDEATGWWQRVRRVDPSDTRAAGYLARAEAQKARMQEILTGGR